MELNIVDLNVLNELADGAEEIAYVLYQLRNELDPEITESMVVESVKKLETNKLISLWGYNDARDKFDRQLASTTIQWAEFLFTYPITKEMAELYGKSRTLLLSLTPLGRTELMNSDWYNSYEEE